MNTRNLARGALVAALYAALTVVLGSIPYGLIQFRPAEALTVLPILFPEAIPGLYVGCIIANLYGGAGPWDIWLGSAVTLVAAYLTFATRRSWLAYLWPILLNALIVPAYLIKLVGVSDMTYIGGVASIGISQAVVVLVLGIPFLRGLKRVHWRK